MTETEEKMSKEAFYDATIAPELARLAKMCEENGLSFIAMAEFGHEETGRTVTLAKNSGIGIRMAECAMKAHGNFDSFAFAMANHAKETGHGSLVLAQMGVPTSPKATGAA